MASGWQGDNAWSRQYLPAIKRVLGEHLFGDASVEDDQQRNTDLIILNLSGVRVACRVRRFKYCHPPFSDQFTIRSRRSKNETELCKITHGWGDRFFYGFAAREGPELAAWMLGDLYVFRGWFFQQVHKNSGSIPGQEMSNGDSSSDFRVFNISDLPPGFVVARKRYESVKVAQAPAPPRKATRPGTGNLFDGLL